jgi:pimeloyl-ACP methyl ester carboxylesterase
VGQLTYEVLADAVERAMDEAGFATAHIAGNSLGGFVALQLASRGRAESVVALAPAGGWALGSAHADRIADHFATTLELARAAAPYADQIMAAAEGRRRATQFTAVNYEHIPAELLAHQLCGVAAMSAAEMMIEHRRTEHYSLDAAHITCPVRVVWGTDDGILTWPACAVRYRDEWVPNADWIELEGVGHCPQLDVPLETAQLIVGFTS